MYHSLSFTFLIAFFVFPLLCLPPLQQSMVLLLHSQHQYIFDYDSGDRLSAVTMPSVARHTMQTIRSIGYYRNIYNPPESNASVTVDYSEDGQVCGCVRACVCGWGFVYVCVCNNTAVYFLT